MEKVPQKIHVEVVRAEPSSDEAQHAWAVHQRVVQLITIANKAYIELGRLLDRIQQERLFEKLGYKSFKEYLASPEVSLHQSTVFRLIRIARMVDEGLVSEHDAIQIGSTRLYIASRALEAANTPEEREEILHEARTLAMRDLRHRMRERLEEEYDELREVRETASHLLVHAAREVWITTNPAEYLRSVAEELLRLADRFEWIIKTTALLPGVRRKDLEQARALPESTPERIQDHGHIF